MFHLLLDFSFEIRIMMTSAFFTRFDNVIFRFSYLNTFAFKLLKWETMSTIKISIAYVAGNCGNQAFPEMPGVSSIA